MANKQKSPEELQRHITATYLNLRMGIAAIGALLPVVLWVGGLLFLGLSLKPSMSAYYHSGMRDVFVGALYAVGAFLYLYKGFSGRENYALNAAGVLAVCIAMFPTGLPGDDPDGLTVHGASAVLFFAAIAYVCIFRGSDTLHLMRDQQAAERYSRSYKLLGIAMLASPVAAYVFTMLLPSQSEEKPVVFFIELFGIAVFAAYWFLKSREIAATDAERLVAERAVQADASGKLVRRATPQPEFTSGPAAVADRPQT